MRLTQAAFRELFVGTLIYAVVLGFFDDYTHIVYARSFSYLFLAAIALEALTYLTFKLKSVVLRWLRVHGHGERKLVVGFSLWLILFSSKFVFVWVIDLLFGDDVNIYGFFGILAVVASVTILHRLAVFIYDKLEPTPSH